MHAHLRGARSPPRTRSGYLRLTKSPLANSDSNQVFAELACERLCKPRQPTRFPARSTSYTGRTLDLISLTTASKAAAGTAFGDNRGAPQA